MASSMLGERRWVSARRGGMTVLGKVAVPKPVNLPSQRLENHGLDPNVEIVPKGTVSWGSRVSTVNAWGSSGLSPPSADGSGGSPAHINGRPSSGGSGTRPSTAGSEKSHEPASNAWGPNSRPSSASGLLASSQSSVASLRPRSAETRPGSSQLSRFADAVGENSVAWVGAGAADKPGSASSKGSNFTLNSGDFPTLGSEKNSESNPRSGDSSHGRPSSSSRGAAVQERMESSSCDDGPMDTGEKGEVNTWRRDVSPYPGGMPPNVEKWQSDNQQGSMYHNANISAHHFAPWHGPPIRNTAPDSVWYRGGPPPGPYGPLPPPGGYALEPPPYGYYHPQPHIPSRPLSNSQSGLRPGAGPGAYNPKNGDNFRPHMPDSYVVPGPPVMPVRYPGPLRPYDGYFGPPRMPFCSPNEQEGPSGGGMTGGPGACAFNRYPNQNVHSDPGNFHVRPAPYGPPCETIKEPVDSGRTHETSRGTYKVLLKQHDSWGDAEAAERNEHPIVPPCLEKRNNNTLGASKTETRFDQGHEKDGRTEYSKPGSVDEGPSEAVDRQAEHASFIGTQMRAVKAKTVDRDSVNKTEDATSSAGGSERSPLVKKSPTLIDKIESLNTKARIYDGRHESARLLDANVKDDDTTNKSDNASNGELVTSSGGSDKSIVESSMGGGSWQIETSSQELGEKGQSQIYRRSVHGIQNRADYGGKGRFNVQENEEWRKKSLLKSETPVVKGTDEAPLNEELSIQGKPGEFVPTDYETQRAKMKEIANQRAKQLQKEEEDRIREQKAKALAKLEELNRRTLEDSSSTKSEANRVPQTEVEIQARLEQKASGEVSCQSLTPEILRNTFSKPSVKAMDKSGVSDDLPTTRPLEASSSASTTTPPPIASSLSLAAEADVSDSSSLGGTSMQLPGNAAPKQKQTGHRKKHNVPRESPRDEPIVAAAAEVHLSASSVASSNGNGVNITIALDDSSVQNKKKHSRNARNKQKAEQASSDTGVYAPFPFDDAIKSHSQNGGLNPCTSVVQKTSSNTIEREVDSEHSVSNSVSGDQGWGHLTDEIHGSRVSHQWKPHTRKMGRSILGTRPVEKFQGSESVVWAPVKTSKHDNVEEGRQVGSNNNASEKSGYEIPNNLRGKRAEMERYVPKPVVKELSQQSNSVQPLLSVAHPLATSEEMPKAGGTDFSSKTGVGVETKNEDKGNKQGRTHTSWRRRGLPESSVALQKSNDDPFPAKSDSGSFIVEGQTNNWNSDKPLSVETVSSPAMKDQTLKGKRYYSKVNHSGPGQYHSIGGHSNKDLIDGRPDKIPGEAPNVKISETEGKKGCSRSDYHPSNNEYVSSHWQPKTQISGQSQHGTRGNGGQNSSVQVVKTFPENSSPAGGSDDSLKTEMQKAIITDRINLRPPESMGEKKNGNLFKEGTSKTAGQGPETAASVSEQQHASSGTGRHVQHLGRFKRGQEGAPYGGGGRGGQWHEMQRHQPSSQGDRKKHSNTNYEYQPVGSYQRANLSFNNESAASEELSGGNAAGVGSRYRERSQHHSKRGGNYPGRNHNTASLASYDK